MVLHCIASPSGLRFPGRQPLDDRRQYAALNSQRVHLTYSGLDPSRHTRLDVTFLHGDLT